MKNISKFKISFFIILVLSFFGCKKFVTIDPPITQLVSSSVFEGDQTAISAMNGLYSYMESSNGFASGASNSVGFLTGLSSDELTNFANTTDYVQFYENSLTRENGSLYSGLWISPYKCIYDANGILEGLAGSTQISAALKNELRGEAKFIRAFSNFYLTNLFGEIPLITTSDYLANAKAQREKKDSVYSQILADLVDAYNLLSTDYTYSEGERIRPNRWAAAALLARVYLFLGDWPNAEAFATEVINQRELFNLVTDLNQVFLKNSPEAIWQLMPNQPAANTGEGSIYILTSTPVYAAISPHLLDEFESGDLRKTNWIADTTIGTDTYYYAFKYKVKSSQTLSEYSMVLRLAEQFLIRSEARVNLGNFTGASDDINMIRNRAGLNNISLTTQDSSRLAIFHERKVELFTEWGHRWFDLIRSGKITDVLGPIKNDWQIQDTLFPIPQQEIQTDPNLTQNPGY